jgi:hypothetical protein
MVPQAVKRIVERFWPDLRQRKHVPQLARIKEINDMPTNDPKISTEFRAYKSVDIQLLNPVTKEPLTTSVFKQVPLAVGVNAGESGTFVEPKRGMLCLIQYIDGLDSMPVITNLLPFNQLIPDHQNNDVSLQQSRRSGLFGKNGNWLFKTDGSIDQQSQSSSVKAQKRTENYHEKNTTITGHDKTKIDGNSIAEVMGALKLLVGEKALITALDDLLLGTNKNLTLEAKKLTSIKSGENMDIESLKELSVKSTDNTTIESLKELHVKATKLAKIEGETVWVGGGSVNLLQVVVDLIALVSETNKDIATHNHPSIGAPTAIAAKFTAHNVSSEALKTKLSAITE